MRFRFIDAEKVNYPVVVLCRVLEVWRSGCYAWRRRPEPARVKQDAQLVVEIAVEHRRSRGIYGSPRVHLGLRARGVRVGRKRVERLMRKNGIQGRQKRRFRRTTDSKHAQPIAPNVLGRDFPRGDRSATDSIVEATGTPIARCGWLFWCECVATPEHACMWRAGQARV